jgi:hypothetical protein
VGWALTLTEARRLELDKPHPAELLSRLDKEITAQDIDLAGHTIHDAVAELNDGNLGEHTDSLFPVRKRLATFGYTPKRSIRFAVPLRSAA